MLTEGERYALETFDNFPLFSSEVEAIDLESGISVIRKGYVELSGALLGPLYCRLTDAGRAALAKEWD